MIITWNQIHDAPCHHWVGITHPDGRRLLTDEVNDPIVQVQRRVNKVKAVHLGDWADWVNPGDMLLIAAWLDVHVPAVNPAA